MFVKEYVGSLKAPNLGASSFRINVVSEQVSQYLSPIFFSVKCKIGPQNCFLMLKIYESVYLLISLKQESDDIMVPSDACYG